ncbi:MAG: DUF5652 family protein [Candidatus Berkelbacteria bacterium]|nr:DUF5652 family protein [Candidatus Berkelbacteria bacterium]
MTTTQIPSWFPPVIVTLLIWSLPWKAVALWKAARNNHIAWYIILTIVNTIGILEIFYIFVWSKPGEKKSADKE